MAVTFQEAYRMQEDHDGKFLKKIKLLCRVYRTNVLSFLLESLNLVIQWRFKILKKKKILSMCVCINVHDCMQTNLFFDLS